MSVTVYSKNNCSACDRLKAKLVKEGIDFSVKNVDNDLDAMDYIVNLGLRSVPQVVDLAGNVVTDKYH
jgi:glutaredoxin-like protein NrdH